jgi:division protein 1
VRLWDLRRVDGDVEASEWVLGDVLEEAEEDGDDVDTGGSVVVDHPHSGTNGTVRARQASEETNDDAPGPCVRVLEGHSKGVTALYFENDTLVRLPIPTVPLRNPSKRSTLVGDWRV